MTGESSSRTDTSTESHSRPIAIRCSGVSHDYQGDSAWIGSDSDRSVTALTDVALA